MDEFLKGVLEASPLGLIVIGLNILGLVLKKLPFHPDWLIPIVLPLVGIFLGAQFGPAINISWIASLKHPSVGYGVAGFCCGGFAVWGNQVARQAIAAWKSKQQTNGDGL